jgi:hypothetical protein
MPISILGDGSITGITSGGLPDGIVTNNDLATGISSSKLTGALPILDGSALTGVGVTGIVSSANATAITISSGEDVTLTNALTIQNARSSSGGDGSIIFDPSDSAVSYSIRQQTGDELVFEKYASSAWSDMLRFTSSGVSMYNKLDINSGTVNTIAKFTSGDDNGFIQIEDNDTTGYIDAQNGWISIGGHASSLHSQNLSINVSDGRGLSQFTAKAWVNFDGTGTVAIRDSHNIYSIGDLGTGFYQCGLTTSMANTNYCVTTGAGHYSWDSHLQVDVLTTTTTRIKARRAANNMQEDNDQVHVIIFGD